MDYERWDVTFPEEGQFANVAASSSEPIMVLTLRDLMPDSGGEVAIQSFGVPAVGIEASEAIAVTSSGTIGSHVTAAGEDVSGYRFYAFDNGVTLYFPPDMVVLMTPPTTDV
jgi:hypothetical protein